MFTGFPSFTESSSGATEPVAGRRALRHPPVASPGAMLVALFLLPALALGQPRQGGGVLLIKISSVLNPEGRDAAGACCSGGGDRYAGQVAGFDG